MDYEDQEAAAAAPCRSGEPPRSQERRREPRQVDQTILQLRCPAAEFGTDEQARGQGATT